MHSLSSRYSLLLILLLSALLRFSFLSTNPPALYWDEASLGYNAFSILTRGVDEHGVRFPITHFLAYGDAKPPLYIYATAISMAIFGVGEFAVRFPSALSGVIAVGLTYLLTRQLFAQHKHSRTLSLIAAFLLAISPWHIQMSRAAFEANLSLTFFLSGFTLFLMGLKRPRLWLLSALFFSATLYTFNSYRLFLPPFLLLLLCLYFRSIKTHFKSSLLSLVFASLLSLPLIPFVLSPQAKLRFDEVTIFNNHAPVLEANLRQELNHQAPWSKLIHNRRVLFALDFLRHTTDQLKPEFLFISGDVNPRLSTRDQGVMYLIELPLLLIGLYQLLSHKSKQLPTLLLVWFFLALIPAGVARETPHALRSLQALPVPQLILALGILTLITTKPRTKPLVILAYIVSLIFYLDTLFIHYPRHWSDSWQYGYKELVSYIKTNQYQYDRIYVTDKLGRPHTYLLFYLQYDPLEYIANRDAGGDAFGFTYTYSFDKYYFTGVDLSDKPQDQTWLVVSGADAPPSQGEQLTIIDDPNSNPVFILTKI